MIMLDYRHMIVFLVCAGQTYGLTPGTNTNETEAQVALDEYNMMAQEVFHSYYVAKFNNVVNLANYTARRKLNEVISDMRTIYSKAKVCVTTDECLEYYPGLAGLLSKSRDYDRLKNAWVGWRNETGRKMKELYPEYVTLNNEALNISGWQDGGEYWRSYYEMDGFEEEMNRLFEDLYPLYKQLHAYARRKLVNLYGNDKFPDTRQIPAHILGDMWGHQWHYLMDVLAPYKNKTSLDITSEMVRQNYTYLTMFQKAEEFFISLGLKEMPEEFWNYSMLVKPTDGREVVCHETAWNMFKGNDFRISQCADVTNVHFEIAYHEMGHLEYYLHYKNLPVSFRNGANPGFHEAVGDMMGMSFQSLNNLRSIGLVTELQDDIEADLNFLMNMALQKVVLIPFAYLIEKWRWSVFRGDTTPDKYNEDWWKMRCKYQGVSPPVERTSSDFDPGSKFHVPANVPYIRYFISFIIQFQFHKAACLKAGHTGALYKCNLYNSKEAGKAIGDMLKLGSSEKWPVVMKQLTGQEKMSVEPLKEYFDPLYQYLLTENEGEIIDWEDACPNFA